MNRYEMKKKPFNPFRISWIVQMPFPLSHNPRNWTEPGLTGLL